MARLKEKFNSEIVPAMEKEFNYGNRWAVPRLEKIVVNMGVGEASKNIKLLDSAVEEIAQITGQRPVKTYAKKSIAGFKLRAGMPVGCKVTLRGERMYEFLDRLINVALPRVRDFRGLSGKAFDGRGNYTVGITEQIIFPEINYDKVERFNGMDICIVTSARTDREGKEFLRLFGMPFKD
ncbi:MAG: 50S ribosomal protein L5 [bacterium]|nr:50S ribosomal protein L5 [bacterium]